MNREKKIVRTSVLGIIVNSVLATFKLLIGILAGSIAVVLDAVNNFSDALSSVITIVGTKLAGKKPDKKHPFGYGRVEYITSAIIAVLVLSAGVTALREALEKIIHPTSTEFTVWSLIVIGVAVVVKFGFGAYVKQVGKNVNSQALVASGNDAFFDGILSAATLVGGICALNWGWNLDGWLSAVLSIFILRAGFETLMESAHDIIGARPDAELAQKIKTRIQSYEAVQGAYDLTLNNYGPNRTIGSVHIAVPEKMTAREIHHISRQIAMEIYQEFGVVMSVGVYAVQDSDLAQQIKDALTKVLAEYPAVLNFHGLYVNETEHQVVFDIIVDFKNNAQQIKQAITEKMTQLYPEFNFQIVLDMDYSD